MLTAVGSEGNRLRVPTGTGNDARRLKDLAAMEFVERKADTAVLGPPGVVKPHIAVALSMIACRAGHSIHYAVKPPGFVEGS
ncbi:ATP-binding protein [Dietzia lutea]|uniref:ATP-binding protein n=1 Tax=Dietzia lutea TaxID=546160 RepID=UPI0022869DFF|nr:ATP-binding protein [Dietzia lutea]